MAINFPDNPLIDDTFTSGDTTWKWSGAAWNILPSTSVSFTNLTVSNSTQLADVEVENLTLTGTLTGVELNDLSNVLTTPTDNQVLSYNSSLSKWTATTLASTFSGGTITNPLIINNSTVTSSATTGALRITGGVGIGDDLYVAGSITIEDENLDIKAAGDIRFWNDTNTNYVGFSAPSSIFANKIYVLPQSDGASGQYLRTNGLGTLTWASVTSPSGGTPPGGVNTNVQFNDNLEFGGNNSFTFDAETLTVTVSKLVSTDTTPSTSTTTGSAIVAGGLGVSGSVNVGGAVSVGGASNLFTGNTASSSTTTGTIVVTGGVGISGNVSVGSNVVSDATPSLPEHLTNKRYVDSNVLAFSVAFGI